MDPGNTAEAGALSSTWREAWAAASKRGILGFGSREHTGRCYRGMDDDEGGVRVALV